MRISDWSSDVCSSDLRRAAASPAGVQCPIAAAKPAIDRRIDAMCRAPLGEPGGDRLDSLGLTRRNPAGEPATATRTRANGQRNDPGRDRTDHRGAGARRPVGDLDRQVVRQAYRVDRRFGLGRARRSGRAARPQRRGQDDVLLFGDGAGEARFGPRAARWRGYHRAADVPPRILGLGYLPQETSIFRGLTIEKNILTVLELAEPDKAARQQRLDKDRKSTRLNSSH